jgi:hypothetical protein
LYDRTDIGETSISSISVIQNNKAAFDTTIIFMLAAILGAPIRATLRRQAATQTLLKKSIIFTGASCLSMTVFSV